MSDEMCVHIHAPAGQRVRRIFRCARCRVQRRHVVTFYEWYGPITICCHCGAYRNDGELRPPTKRDDQLARHARRLWPTLPREVPS